jgi:hypothetical protein
MGMEVLSSVLKEIGKRGATGGPTILIMGHVGSAGNGEVRQSGVV